MNCGLVNEGATRMCGGHPRWVTRAQQARLSWEDDTRHAMSEQRAGQVMQRPLRGADELDNRVFRSCENLAK